MVTVTIGKSYFEALLRRAEFHASHQDVDFGPNLFNNVTISKAEHEYLLQSERNYHLLKNALFRGGLTNETLETLLEGESGVTTHETSHYDYSTGREFPDSRSMLSDLNSGHHQHHSLNSDGLGTGHRSHGDVNLRAGIPHSVSYGLRTSSIASPPGYEDDWNHAQRVPVHDQRTLLIANLSERTTHKDLAGIIRGGRLLDIFLRTDHTATISFVEGAAEFLAYTKRTDIYLHTKRLEFRWADRQFRVPSHVSNKILNGATRNLVVRGAADKLTTARIKDHLDHIHNLIVVDIVFRNGDAYVSINSIHNALFARTCMMSRTAYKGLRIEYFADECAGPLPCVHKAHVPTPPAAFKSKPITNTYAILDTESDLESNSEDESYITEGICIDRHHWVDATAA